MPSPNLSLTVFFLLLLTTLLQAQDAPLTAKEIFTRDVHRPQGEDMVSTFNMDLINAGGQVRNRKFIRYIDGNPKMHT